MTGKEKENHISRACPKRLIARFHVRILNLFTLKSNILAQDQTSFLSSINSLFGLRGPGSIPVLDSSQIWSLQVIFQKVFSRKLLHFLMFSSNLK